MKCDGTMNREGTRGYHGNPDGSSTLVRRKYDM